jgi:hypothetical protein
MTERGAGGRWLPGTGSPNPTGRKDKETEDELRDLLRRCVTREDREDLFRGLVKLAKRGNIRAYELLLDRLYGKVKEHHEISGDGGGAVALELFINALKKVYQDEPGDPAPGS